MSTPHIIQTIIEFLLVALLIIGFIYEPLVIEWEDKVFKIIKERWNRK